MATMKGKYAKNLINAIDAQWLKQIWDERTSNYLCLKCSEPLREYEIDEGHISCYECRGESRYQ